MFAATPNPLKSAWEVLVIFLIPFGGGIPAGVLLAETRGLAWPVMVLLYFISDVILAFLFEPVLRLFIKAGRRVNFLQRMSDLFKKSVERSAALYGGGKKPIALILISFGIDPMTGRAAAIAAGHGVVVGWLIAITGDMMYFTVLMVSTLWLKSVLGDGTSAMLIILAAMILIPLIVQKMRKPTVAKIRID